MLKTEDQLEWFVLFLAVVDTSSFGAAAEATHRSQPRVSQHVAALEREAGGVLFDRRKRPFALTDAGGALADHARRVLGELHAAEEAMAARRRTARGVVTLGRYPSPSAAFVPRVLGGPARTTPDIEVILSDHSIPVLDDAFAAGRIDVCLRPLPPPRISKSLRHQVLWREPLVVVHPPTHPLAALPEPLAIAVAEFPVCSRARRLPRRCCACCAAAARR
ncbi:LysR family transcriptional regulator [Streptomyces sp. SID13726]|uniref:LysR family transcriptional regulator n=1 Tax=Streptomyces sp. SID13726 TaxID=2706058 RepID=UPI0013B99085|nr:LysR family transcriptional regulator [Streptomyces sp. SID13726]